MRRPLLDNVDGNPGRVGRPVERVPTYPQRIFAKLDAVRVMVLMIALFVMQYYFLNGYITLLLYCILLTAALEAPGSTLRIVDSDPWTRIVAVKFKFLFVGSLALYCTTSMGLYFNRSCVCNWAN